MDSSAIVKKRVKDFFTKYGLRDITIETLLEIFASQGYRVVPFNAFTDEDAADLLLEELKLTDYSRRTQAFTYKRGSIKIVFIDDALGEEDKLKALIHEEGHIFCEHIEHMDCSCTNVEDEWEANEFAHYVLNPTISIKAKLLINRNKKACVILLCAVSIVLLVLGAITIYRMNSGKYTRVLEYYVTEYGEKYHTKNCDILEGKDNIRKITEAEYNSGKYTPCKICNPNNK